MAGREARASGGRRLPAVILAAGASRRMGRPKALLPIGEAGECFVTRLVRTLVEGGAGLTIVVVGGPDEMEVRRALEGHPARPHVVRNPNPETGQISSVVTALDAIERVVVAEGLLVTPVDTPLVGADTVRKVVEAYSADPSLVVRPERDGRHGHPVVFPRALFDDLRRCDPTLGARAVVAAHRDLVLDIPVADAGAFIDIDTRDDYVRHVGPWPFGDP